MSPYLLREEILVLKDRWQGQPVPHLYRELSELLFTVGKIPAALNLMERSLSLDAEEPEAFWKEDGSAPNPSTAERWFRRGLEYADACLYEEACGSLGTALILGYDGFETHYCLAGMHKSLGRLGQAENHCRKAMEQNPVFCPAFILLGSIIKLDGRLLESAEAVQKALFIDPDCAPAYYDLACYRALSGEIDGAFEALDRALAKGFCDFDWMRRDPDLEPLRAFPEFALLLETHAPKKAEKPA